MLPLFGLMNVYPEKCAIWLTIGIYKASMYMTERTDFDRVKHLPTRRLLKQQSSFLIVDFTRRDYCIRYFWDTVPRYWYQPLKKYSLKELFGGGNRGVKQRSGTIYDFQKFDVICCFLNSQVNTSSTACSNLGTYPSLSVEHLYLSTTD